MTTVWSPYHHRKTTVSSP